MSVAYLVNNIFGMALGDMAVSSGSINDRLCSVYVNYLYKIDWEKDLLSVPIEYQVDFLKLKQLLVDELNEQLVKRKADLVHQYKSLQVDVSEETLNELCNPRLTIKGMHWQKAKKACTLIRDIYFNLSRTNRM